MNKYVLTSVLFLISMNFLLSQTVEGKWYTMNSDTNEKESIIEVYKENNKIYAKILTILNEEDKHKLCDLCTGKDKDKPIEGMVILKGLQKDGEEWSDGKILDPQNGKYYKCYISLINKNKLKIRGYIGFSLIGRTEYWQRLTN